MACQDIFGNGEAMSEEERKEYIEQLAKILKQQNQEKLKKID